MDKIRTKRITPQQSKVIYSNSSSSNNSTSRG